MQGSSSVSGSAQVNSENLKKWVYDQSEHGKSLRKERREKAEQKKKRLETLVRVLLGGSCCCG